jgi:hypothetical protein
MSSKLTDEIYKLQKIREQLANDWKFCIYEAYFINFQDIDHKDMIAVLSGEVVTLQLDFAGAIFHFYSSRIQPVSTNTLEAYRKDYIYTFVPFRKNQLVYRDDCGLSIPHLLYNDLWSVDLFLYDSNRKQITDIPLHFLQNLDYAKYQR